MECEEFITDYSDFLDHRFEEHSLSSYCEHLLRCSDCAGYDRVMRRGLELVRQLELPGACPDFVPRVKVRGLGSNRGLYGRAERGRAVMVAGLAALVLLAAGSAAILKSGGTMELAPVVVEPAAADELPSLWGPAPRFTSAVNFLVVPELTENSLFRAPRERFSLFRAPLRTSSRAPLRGEQAALE